LQYFEVYKTAWLRQKLPHKLEDLMESLDKGVAALALLVASATFVARLNWQLGIW
jgi:hypothetical protein